ncbi:hypothetical protein ABFV80_000953 [Vandammella animalimorsus]|uniref:hypothetical protein n=1 Tax=Vandammella animalimorsus TaxID=2029117 RepID=UPI00325B8218
MSQNPFDDLYARDFRLRPLSLDPIAPAPRPPRAQGLDDAFVEPAYGVRIYRATASSEAEPDGNGVRRVRHFYSRRQAFNADNSRYLVWGGNGAWYLYDAKTFQKIKKIGALGGAAEPIWHPSDPRKLFMTSNGGRMVWWVLDVETENKQVLFDFTGKTPWPEASDYWTYNEGTTSADGRYLGLMATRYDSASQRVKVYGLLTLDLVEKKIVGTLDASRFPKPGVRPDHVSISASGKYVVPSWGSAYAYTRDFSQVKLLAKHSGHSDLAFGPNGEDFFVWADDGSDPATLGHVQAINIDTMQRFPLLDIYPARGEFYALHISGQAFDKPGWVVISTYKDGRRYEDPPGSGNYVTEFPSRHRRAQYQKVILAELKPGGRVLNVAHIRNSNNFHQLPGAQAYFLEPQASAARDLSRIIFATNFGSGQPESYVIGLPSWFDK